MEITSLGDFSDTHTKKRSEPASFDFAGQPREQSSPGFVRV
jgi:hypothetical protein